MAESPLVQRGNSRPGLFPAGFADSKNGFVALSARQFTPGGVSV